MKRILVTGGAGFLGSHLCERLLSDGHEVISIDNYFTGSRSNVVHLQNHPYFELVRHDVTTPYYAEVDEIYNLACPASPVQYQINPIKTIKTSVMGAINMLSLAKRIKAKILQASTSEVYGDPEVHPQPENYWGNVNPIGARSCYDEGKRCAESIFINYHIQDKVNIRIARIFNTYGPRMDPGDGRVISNFIVQALKGEEITIFGDGSQTRSFQFIDDLVEGLIRLMNAPDELSQPINLGNPHEVTITLLADKILELTGSGSKKTLYPLPSDDPLKRNPDITLAREKLNWSPEIDLDSGLKKTIDYFKKILKL
jgi:UDP-glucuronate decarboxylase